MKDETLTPAEGDRLFRYPRGRSIRLAKAGKLPAVFLPDGEIRFDRQAIADALAGMRNPKPRGHHEAYQAQTRHTAHGRRHATMREAQRRAYCHIRSDAMAYRSTREVARMRRFSPSLLG